VHAYVINLACSTDRRRHIEAELAKVGLGYEVVPAVDGRKLDLSGPQLVRPGDPGQCCSPDWAQQSAIPGVVGCSLSHLLVYERVLASGAEGAVVLEDDIALALDLAQVTNALPSHLSGAEVVLLNFDSRDTCRMSSQDAHALPGGRLLCLPLDVGQPHSTAGYVITREACRRMVDQMTPARASSDDWAFFYRHGALDRLRCVVPMPIQKSPRFPSTIIRDAGGIKARLRAAALARGSPLLHQAIAWRRARILRQGVATQLVDAPFIEKPSRLDDTRAVKPSPAPRPG
jgi:glycosyl transferase family 25